MFAGTRSVTYLHVQIYMNACVQNEIGSMAAVHAIQQLTVFLCHMYFKQNVSVKQSHVKLLQLIIKGPTCFLNG